VAFKVFFSKFAELIPAMTKDLIIPILAAILAGSVPPAADAAGSRRARPLRDGFVLAGVNGELTRQASSDGCQRWFFKFDSQLSDDAGRVKAGASLELLPSAALEKMTADAQKRSTKSYVLWGRVTKYKDTNFIFPIYFLPFSEIEPSPSPMPASQKTRQKEPELTINEPNDELAIPQEIMARLKTTRILRTEKSAPAQNAPFAPSGETGAGQPQKGLELKHDSILADRTGFIRDSGREARGTGCEVSFVLDALGRSVQRASFGLLPCEVLEQAQLEQSAEADPLRFKIAGILTRYKGSHYLLLERARRVYSHQNFGR